MAISIMRSFTVCDRRRIYVSTRKNFKASSSYLVIPTKNKEEEKKKSLLSVSCLPSTTPPPPSHPLRSEVSFSVGTHLIPHPSKVDRGGEDAFFVSNYNGGVLAIADGVSGWAERDVDPALFPKELMANASSLVEDIEVDYDPRILLRKAHAATSSMGSATVIVAMLEKHGTLKIANVGDCGLRVLREGQVNFSTSPQEHYFDCPFQLSSEMVGQTYLDAMVYRVDLKEGDTIVMGSDGLFDNVFDHEVVSIISRSKDVLGAAKTLADLASSHSKDYNFDSPYSLEARSRGYDVPLWKKILGKKLTGGKPDDITVIVGRVGTLMDEVKVLYSFRCVPDEIREHVLYELTTERNGQLKKFKTLVPSMLETQISPQLLRPISLHDNGRSRTFIWMVRAMIK